MNKEWKRLIHQARNLGVSISAGTDPWGDENWGWEFESPDSNGHHFVMDVSAEGCCEEKVTEFDPSDEEIEDFRSFLQGVSL